MDHTEVYETIEQLGVKVRYRIRQRDLPPGNVPGPWGDANEGICTGLSLEWLELKMKKQDFHYERNHSRFPICRNVPYGVIVKQHVAGQGRQALMANPCWLFGKEIRGKDAEAQYGMFDRFINRGSKSRFLGRWSRGGWPSMANANRIDGMNAHIAAGNGQSYSRVLLNMIETGVSKGAFFYLIQMNESFQAIGKSTLNGSPPPEGHAVAACWENGNILYFEPNLGCFEARDLPALERLARFLWELLEYRYTFIFNQYFFM